jgi:hypothetical protein
MAGRGGVWEDGRPMDNTTETRPMSLLNRTLRAAEALQGEDTAEIRRAARLARLEVTEDVPADPESPLAHALRTRRMLRAPLSTAR